MPDAKIIEIVRQAREGRSDLFAPWAEQEIKVTRDYRACHYAYVEWAIPATPGQNHIIYLDPKGRISGKMAGR